MTMRWQAPSIRVRLTAWYTVAVTTMLVVYAATTFVSVRHEFLEQLDDRLHEDAEDAEEHLERGPDGRLTWAGSVHPVAHSDGQAVYEVWSSMGEQVHGSGADVALPAIALPSVGSGYRYDTLVVDGQRWRSVVTPVRIGGHSVIVRIARPEEPLHGELREILVVLVLGLPLVIALAGIGGYVLARRALTPIDHLATEARRVTAERLHERLSAPNPRDEIGRLTAVINDTLARLESSFDQLRRFTADASHELRTPLAVLRGIGEAAVAERRSAAEYEEALGSMLEEIDRMTTLVDTLLRLSHGDAGTIRLSRELIDLGDLAREVAASLGILAEERGQSLAFDVTADVLASVDRLVLREALTNVLDNAIKYSPRGATTVIRVVRLGNRAIVAVADQGPGILPEHRERIFDRFSRIDESRTRDGGGAGLGLAIAKWAVELHGGRISVVARPEGGSEFRIELPLSPLEHSG